MVLKEKLNSTLNLECLSCKLFKYPKNQQIREKGRAGRLTAGNCYRMWSNATHAKMSVSGTPEIEEVDLGTLVLDLAQWELLMPMN